MDDILTHFRRLPVARFAPGERLLEEGARPGRLYILASGQVQVSKGGVSIARTDTPGALFGEMSVLLDLPVSATVAAVTEVEAHVSEDPAALIASDPVVARHAATLLAARLHAATTYIADLKAQFDGQHGALGMVDRVLDALIEGQPANRRLAERDRAAGAADDPRL